jgi:hypothetical protein
MSTVWSFKGGVVVEAGGDASAGLKDRVPRPGDLMLISREAKLYLSVCEGRCTSRGKETPIMVRETDFAVMRSGTSICQLLSVMFSVEEMHLDSKMHGSASIYMHNLPAGHEVITSARGSLLISFVKTSTGHARSCEHNRIAVNASNLTFPRTFP